MIFRSSRRAGTIPSEEYLDLPTYIFSQEHGNKTALVNGVDSSRINYNKLKVQVEAVASALVRIGVRHGDVVGVVAPNSVEYVVGVMGVMRMGGVVCPCNPLNTPSELKKQMKHSEAVMIMTTTEFVTKVTSLQLPLILLQAAPSQVHNSPPIYTLSELLSSPSSQNSTYLVKQSDRAVILYSSGTTGYSKGVILTHSNLISTTLQYEDADAAEDEVILCTTPMFHVMGFVMVLCTHLKRGVSIVVMTRFFLQQMLEAVEHHQITELTLVPTIFKMLANSPLLQKYDLKSLRYIKTGGAPLGKDSMLALKARLPHVILRQGYGLTEASGTGSRSPIEDDIEHYGSSGILGAYVEAKVIDVEKGDALGSNERGELWIKGPGIMTGYLKDPKATAATVDAEGWLRTGDLVYFDEIGHLYVVDRIKELIKYNAFQVAPAELEELLLSHPLVVDAAVVPFPDEMAGEIPAAFVVTSAESVLTESSIMDYVASQVAPYKKIRRVVFVDSIPKLPSGKILRRQLMNLSSKL